MERIWQRWNDLHKPSGNQLLSRQGEELRQCLHADRSQYMPLLTAEDCAWLAEEFGSPMALALTAVVREDQSRRCVQLADTSLLPEVICQHGSAPWVPAVRRWVMEVLAPSVYEERGWGYEFM
jgi:hypothetical protein